jgi:TatD DNase family protein
LDLFISFGGNITFKKSASIREAARIVPDTRLLVETDSPYLSPEPVRGRTNHPGHLGFTISALADLRSASEEEIVRQTSANAASLFGNKLQNPAK